MRLAIGLAWLILPGAALQEKRHAVPDLQAQKDAEKFIREVFKDEYAQAGIPAKGILARKLLGQAEETRDDPRARYVLFREARDLAILAGDSAAALGAVRGLVRHYETPALDAKFAVLSALGLTVQAAAERKSVIEECLALVQEALALDETALAERAAREAAAQAKRLKDVSLVARSEARAREVSDLQKDKEAAKKAREVLATTPDDPAANLAAGRHLCLAKGDWEAGLPHLAKGSDAGLKALAARDLANPAEAKEQMAVGDAWWDLGLRRRAVHWYSKALPSSSGLTRARLEKRLAEAGPVEPAARSAIDLLALIRLEQDTVKGTWKLTGQGLEAPALVQGIVQIPYLPPEEYDLRLVAHLTGIAEINLGLAVGTTHFIIPVDGWNATFTGIEMIDGKSSNANETSRPGRVLKTDTPNSLLCAVRKESIRLVVNGEELLNWKADYRRLSLTDFWLRPRNGTLALGSWKGYRVSQLELVPVSGSGKPLR